MLIALYSIMLSSLLAVAADNYCEFTFIESLRPGSDVPESNDKYFYLDVEGYKKDSFSNLDISKSFSIQGDFGSLIKVSNTGGEMEYSVNSISVHIPPEHYYETLSDLEIMIHHFNSDGDGLVLSFLFSISEGEATSSRQFFNDLIDAADGSSDIDPTDISGGYYHIKKFYYNKGPRITATSNECNNYEWAIYSEVIKMSSSDFKDIKKKLVEVDEEGRKTDEAVYDRYIGSQDEYSFMLVMGIVYLIV